MIGAVESLPVEGGVVVRDAPARGGGSRRVMTIGCGEILCARCAGRAELSLRELPGVDGVRMLWERDRIEVYAAESLSDVIAVALQGKRGAAPRTRPEVEDADLAASRS